jgi:hypothetical protein
MLIENYQRTAARLDAAQLKIKLSAKNTPSPPSSSPAPMPDIFSQCRSRGDVDEVVSKLRRAGIPAIHPMKQDAGNCQSPEEPYWSNVAPPLQKSAGRVAGEALGEAITGVLQIDGWNLA